MDVKYIALKAKELVGYLGEGEIEDVTKYMSESGRADKIVKVCKGYTSPVDACHFTAAMVSWVKYGYPVFDVADDLLAGLLLTTPSDTVGFPHLPLPSFMIRFSPGFVPYPTLASNLNRKTSDPDWGRPEWLSLIHVSYLKNVPVAHGDGENILRIASMSDSADLDSHVLVDVIKEKPFVSPQQYLEENESILWEGSTLTDPECRAMDTSVIRIVFNLCSWLESVGGLATRKQADQVLHRMARKSRKLCPKRWILCSNVSISPEIVDAAKQSARGLSGGWSVTRRYVVRGHVRNQACGTGRLERRVVWIAPYWKGPAGGDVLNHVYKVAEKLKEGKGSRA